MKRIAVALVVLLAVAAVGYKVGVKYVSEAVINKVANQVLSGEEIDQLVRDPQVKKILEERLGTKAWEDLLKRKPGAGAENGLAPQNGAAPGDGSPTGAGTGMGTEAGSGSNAGNNASGAANNGGPAKGAGGGLVFNSAEEALQFLLTKFSRAELNNFAAMAEGGVTAEEKSQIKAALTARLTPEEFQALKVIGLIELQKRQNTSK